MVHRAELLAGLGELAAQVPDLLGEIADLGEQALATRQIPAHVQATTEAVAGTHDTVQETAKLAT